MPFPPTIRDAGQRYESLTRGYMQRVRQKTPHSAHRVGLRCRHVLSMRRPLF